MKCWVCDIEVQELHFSMGPIRLPGAMCDNCLRAYRLGVVMSTDGIEDFVTPELIFKVDAKDRLAQALLVKAQRKTHRYIPIEAYHR